MRYSHLHIRIFLTHFPQDNRKRTSSHKAVVAVTEGRRYQPDESPPMADVWQCHASDVGLWTDRLRTQIPEYFGSPDWQRILFVQFTGENYIFITVL